MARCDEGYLCDVCGKEVPNMIDSDLYLRFVIGEIAARELLSAPERHIRCNPTLAQFIVSKHFEPVTVEGPFSKAELDPTDVSKRETLVTAGYHRLRELPGSGLAVSEYPLSKMGPSSND